MAFRHGFMLDEGSLVPDPAATFKDQSVPTPAPCPPPMAVLDLGALDGANGFRVDGASDYDYVGSAVAGAGDVNGDGFADVITGASFADVGGNTIGAAYVVFGQAAGGPAAIDLSALDGANGFRLPGTSGSERAGVSVGSAGDMNGDGFGDVIVGAMFADFGGYNAGSAYVVYGKAGGFSADFDLSALDGKNGFRLDGSNREAAGSSVSTAGDVNGDGFDDLIIGAGQADHYTGAAYVVFGKAGGLPAAVELSALDGANGFRLAGAGGGSSAGDVNGDGFDDLILGASNVAYVVFGKAAGFAPAMDLSALDGSNGFRLVDPTLAPYSGFSASAAGDVNGDGLADLILGAPVAHSAYVVFGQAGASTATFDLSSLDGTNGFRLTGAAGGRAGISVSNAGDVNGDGFDDLIIGDHIATATAAYQGAAYVVYGHADGFAPTIDLTALDGTDGFRIDGAAFNDRAGYSVAAAGDVNGDGFDDLVVGAVGVDLNGFNAGAAYVIYGGDITCQSSQMGTGGDDSLVGTGGMDTLSGLAGNDTLRGLAGNDSLLGGLDNDSLRGSTGNDLLVGDNGAAGSGGDDRLRGDDGNDTLLGNGGNDSLAGNDGNDHLEGQDGNDTLRGGQGSDRLQGEGGDDNLSGGAGADTLTGGKGNDHLAGGAGTDQLHGGRGNDTMAGGAGKDRLTGAEGDDSLLGGSDNDSLQGSAGNDRLVGDNGMAGSGSDDTLRGDDGNDTLLGNGGNDSLAGNDENDHLEGQDGNDTLRGDQGNDRLRGEDGNDVLNGGAGADTLAGGEGNDHLAGGGGTDRLHGDQGNDTIAGGDDDDRLTGAEGDDSLDGGSGIDTAIFAGKIADYAIQTVGGVTTVTDLKPSVDGNDGTDTLTAVEHLQFSDGTVNLGGQLSSIDLAVLTPDQGVVIYGANALDFSGLSVSAAGDVNGDGFDDFIIGAPGESYVIFGTDAGFGASLDLATLTPEQGFAIIGAGASVSSAGDLNGDGFDDLVIGAGNAGKSYVVFGSGGGFGASLDLATLTPAQGFVITAAQEVDYSGASVSSAGDVNGDGFDDVIIGAPGRVENGATGAAYVIFGNDTGFGASIDLAALTPSQGFAIRESFGTLGSSVSAAGDVNGDGVDDVVVGDSEGNAAYVIFGTNAGFGTGVDVGALTPAQGFAIFAEYAGRYSEISVSAAGDVNGDGLDDLLVGTPLVDSAGGETYVIYGTTAGFGSGIDLATLTPSQGFAIFAADAGDHLGRSVSAAGDVNGDGLDDLLVDAPLGDAAGNEKTLAGESYVIFGTASGFGEGLHLATLEPSQGFVIYGADPGDKSHTSLRDIWGTGARLDELGSSVSVAGDVNGDGFADLIIGAYTADGAGNAKNNAGDSYVIFGGPLTGGGAIIVGTNGGDTLTGTASAETLIGGGGNDSLQGSGGTDTAQFAGSIADYKITAGGGITTVEDLAPGVDGNDGTDVMRSVERLQFADGVLFIPGALSEIELSSLQPAEGAVIYSAQSSDAAGSSVRAAGDVNGDGFDDLIIGAPGGDGPADARTDAGESYVIFGTAAGLGTSLDLAALTAAQGFVIYGVDAQDATYESRPRISVSSAGDVNGDGFADLIIGAPGGDAAGNAKDAAGESYVIFGSGSGFGPSIDLAALTPAQGFVISGADALDQSGFSVSSAGDINGDGFDDLIVGTDTPYYSSAKSYVIFGTAAGFGANIDLAALTPAQGFIISGAVQGDVTGVHVSSAGDMNGDGFDDLVMAVVGPGYGGASYVIFGNDSGFGAGIDLAALTPSQGFVIVGGPRATGSSVSSAGDVNGDGFGDLIIGSASSIEDPDQYSAEQSYVVFGTAAGFGSSINLGALTPSQGFAIFGPDAGVNYSRPMVVSSAGDVNGDGLDDMIVGGPSGYNDSFVIYGTAAGFGSSLDLATLTPAQGFVIHGAGDPVSAAGDVNGDGFADLIVGAGGASGGDSFVIYGGDFTGSVTFAGTSGADSLAGTGKAETFVAGQGDDTLVGAGGADVFHGGAGDDTIAIATLDFHRVDGGAGTDTLRLDGADLNLDLTSMAGTRIQNVERIDITGSGNNTLTLSVHDVLDLSDSSNTLLVKGDAGDSVHQGAGWTAGGTTVVGSDTYQVYTAGQATLLVDTDISTVA